MEVIDPAIAQGGGRIVKVMGDGLLVEFGSPEQGAVITGHGTARMIRAGAV